MSLIAYVYTYIHIYTHQHTKQVKLFIMFSVTVVTDVTAIVSSQKIRKVRNNNGLKVYI